jgi:hypothetical protein
MMNINESENMKEVERKPFSSESMRVRCPHCRKLYMVQFADVQESKPRFECVQCRTRFWLSLPDMDLNSELTGIPVQVKETPQNARKVDKREFDASKAEPCPKCFKLVQPGQAECQHCGVLIGKMKELTFQEGGPQHSPALAAGWKKLLGNYGDEAIHREFLRLAQTENSLPYAAAQYGQLLKLMPSDETTEKRIREINALALTMVPPKQANPRSSIYARVWQVPLLGAVVMMAVGMMVPVFRNMVGVGAAVFFVALALQIQLRHRN